MGWNDHMPDHSGDARAALIEAKAFDYCEPHDVPIYLGDTEADSRAYAIATNRWKAGEIEGEREEVMEAIKNEIEMAADGKCPQCVKIMRDD